MLIYNTIFSLRTQGSTKIFKCNNDKICINNISATLSANSILAYFPDPTTCYPGSRFKQSYTFNLESSSSSLILVDWFTSGRQVVISYRIFIRKYLLTYIL